MKETSQVFSKSTRPSLTLLVLFILLSGCLEPIQEQVGPDVPTKDTNEEADQYISIQWKNDTYLKPKEINNKTKIHLKIETPTPQTFTMERIEKIKIKGNDTGKALSYILLDENMNWINETSYLPEFNYKPKIGKQTVYMLAVYLDGSRSFDMVSFDVKDKKEEYKRECSIGNYTDWAVNGSDINKVVHLSCDLIIRANQTVNIRNMTIVFDGANKSLFYDYPNTSIGYEIRVKNGGRLIAYNSSFTAVNGYWNGFIFENGSIVDWYFNNNVPDILDNVNLSYAFRPFIAYQHVYGISTINASWENIWAYCFGVFKEKYEVIEHSIFYQIDDRTIEFYTEQTNGWRSNTFMVDKIRLY